ncbi:MAG: hypothetical protein Q4Q58_07180 [Thermoplasmata archaeon]|nr:hypothetical protein [Thermoplasmata archaeon]
MASRVLEVSSYSTLTGASGMTSLVTIPSASRSLSLDVSVVLVMPSS